MSQPSQRLSPFRSINPATEHLLREYPPHDAGQVESLIEQAGQAFDPWRSLGIAGRAPFILRTGQVLRERRAEFARLMTEEMGKPIGAAETEVDKCAQCCEFFAANALRFLADEDITSDAGRSYLRCDPLGAVLAIMPWNFPLWQVFRFAAPALMAGNVGLLKHAPNVCGCALAIASAFRDAGCPPGVFAALLIDTPAVGAVIEHPVIRAVTLTGSERAGMAVAQQAGKALKKAVLELGGSDPFIVLKDADIPSVARAAADARCINSGQSCIAAKRFIVERPIIAAFEKAFAAALAALVVGDPAERATQLGPLARQDLLDNLADQVTRSIAAGARLVVGGERLPRKGYFYPPTLLAEVRPGNPAFDEETFGPVAAMIVADDPQDALRLANTSKYGLGASIWTRDIPLAQRLAGLIDAGCVFVNGPVKSDPRLPFGGVKRSGYGRELSEQGIREFVNLKTVWVK
jgi:succinate-semialdehyde dehydrogenase/glutarate-semialdehyde dehydrogenase